MADLIRCERDQRHTNFQVFITWLLMESVSYAQKHEEQTSRMKLSGAVQALVVNRRDKAKSSGSSCSLFPIYTHVLYLCLYHGHSKPLSSITHLLHQQIWLALLCIYFRVWTVLIFLLLCHRPKPLYSPAVWITNSGLCSERGPLRID